MNDTLTRFKERLACIDLDPILYRLVVAEDGPRWNINFAEEVELWYRRYHTLFFLFPHEIVVPTKMIDEFWHFHILDTQKYLDDCMILHGKLIHHFPYLGLRGADDQVLLKTSFQKTLDICTATFGASPVCLGGADASDSVCGGGGKCGGRQAVRPTMTRHRNSVHVN